eukprot:78306-Alexandrium_andersonii.AAC.1
MAANFVNAVSSIPTCDWFMHYHDHHASLYGQLQHMLRRCFSSREPVKLRQWITDDTGQVISRRRQVRTVLRECRQDAQRLVLSQCMLAWKCIVCGDCPHGVV